MMRKHWSRTPVALALAIAIFSMYSMIGVYAQTSALSGSLSVAGDVTVNGARAISGATIYSGSTIVTSKDSSAVINLGKAGRIELQPNSSARISFNTNAGVNAGLDAGRVRLSLQPNFASTVTATSGTAIADSTQANTYSVDVSCGDIKVATEAGQVELRADNAVKQVAAGQTGVAGQVAAGTRCARLANAPRFGTLTGGALAALLLAGGAAAAIGIVAATRRNNNLGFGSSVIILSPIAPPR